MDHPISKVSRFPGGAYKWIFCGRYYDTTQQKKSQEIQEKNLSRLLGVQAALLMGTKKNSKDKHSIPLLLLFVKKKI